MYIRPFKSNFEKSILIYNRWFVLVCYPCYEETRYISLRCKIFKLKNKNIPLSLISREAYLKFYPTNKTIYIRYEDGSSSLDF